MRLAPLPIYGCTNLSGFPGDAPLAYSRSILGTAKFDSSQRGPDSASLMFVTGGLVVAMSTSTSLHHPPSSLQRCCCSAVPAASQGCGSSSRRGLHALFLDDSPDTFASPATPPPSLLLPATTAAAVAVATVSEPSLPRHAAASSDNNKWWHRQQHAWSSTLLSRHDTVAANWLRTVASHTDGRSSAASIINTFLIAADADLAGTAAMRPPPSSRPTAKDTGVVVPSNTVVSKSGQTKSSLTTSTTPAATAAAVAKAQAATTMTASATAATTSSTTSSKNDQSSSPDRPPTVNEVSQLQEALLLFYGTNPNLSLSYELLSQCILTWETTHQSTNEIASLYRIRGDINMGLVQFTLAENDYSKAIQYLQQQQRGSRTPPENMKNNEYGGEEEEEEEAKEEYTASLLGRARSIRARGSAASVIQARRASKDYETYFILTSNLDNDDTNPTTTTSAAAAAAANSKTNNNNNYNENDNSNNRVLSDTIIDGIQHNPYAAWEWGMVNRVAQQYNLAALIHGLASTAFDEIGDPPRSVICFLDKGIDMALDIDTVSSGGGSGGGSNKGQQLAIVKDTLERAISSTVDVSGRDVELLQRVVAKEGEARIVLSGILWNTNNSKSAAESQYGTACSRLDELNADYNQRRRGGPDSSTTLVMKSPRGASLGYSIDDIVGADMASCSRFKNEKFVQEKLVWSDGLRSAVNKFLTLSR